jgi:hypothetical protein
VVAQIFAPAHKFFDGLVVQDIIGQCWVAIPHLLGKCVNMHISELDNHRILEAKSCDDAAVFLSEKNGKYYRSTISFNFSKLEYAIRIDKDVSYDSVSLISLGNGIKASVIGDSMVEVFKDVSKIKQIPNPPISSELELVTDYNTVQFILKKNLYSMKLK